MKVQILQVTFKNFRSNLFYLIFLYLMIQTIPRKLFSIKKYLFNCRVIANDPNEDPYCITHLKRCSPNKNIESFKHLFGSGNSNFGSYRDT